MLLPKCHLMLQVPCIYDSEKAVFWNWLIKILRWIFFQGLKNYWPCTGGGETIKIIEVTQQLAVLFNGFVTCNLCLTCSTQNPWVWEYTQTVSICLLGLYTSLISDIDLRYKLPFSLPLFLSWGFSVANSDVQAGWRYWCFTVYTTKWSWYRQRAKIWFSKESKNSWKLERTGLKCLNHLSKMYVLWL